MYRRNVICTSCNAGQYLQLLYKTVQGHLVGACVTQPTGLSLPTEGQEPADLAKTLASLGANTWDAPKVRGVWVPPAPVDTHVQSFILVSYGTTSFGSFRDNYYKPSPGSTCSVQHTHSMALVGWAKVTVLSKDPDATGKRSGETVKNMQPLTLRLHLGSQKQACCTEFGGTMKANPSWLESSNQDLHCYIPHATMIENYAEMWADIEEQMPLNTLPL